jgi:hypothetical protein
MRLALVWWHHDPVPGQWCGKYRFDQHDQSTIKLFLHTDDVDFGQANKQLANTRMVELHRDSGELGDLDISKLAESLYHAPDTLKSEEPLYQRLPIPI